MRLAVSTTVVFHIAYKTLLRFPLRCRFAMIADHCLLSIGNTLDASLAAVLLPDSYGPFVFAIFGFLSASELMCWFYHEVVAENSRRMRVLRQHLDGFHLMKNKYIMLTYTDAIEQSHY
ncbi:hypothetical protein ACS0TY_025872 [Phlomoides rotata]